MESKAGCQTVSKACDMSRETELNSSLTLRAPIHCLVVIGEKEGFHFNKDDGSHNLVDDWKQAVKSVVEGISFCTFLCRAVRLEDFQAVEEDLAQMTG